MSANMKDCQVAVIGAGPYGLSAAAYLSAAGIEARIFGEPMSFWSEHMPVGMFLRSNWGASHIADPKRTMSLDKFRNESCGGVPSWGKPVPLERFVEYGRWYQKNLVPHVEQRVVAKINLSGNGFEVGLDDGETFRARRVVLAVGIGNFASKPSVFDGVDRQLASHSTEQKDLAGFKGKRVAVIGGGQSALESAALLHEAGANVEVIARQQSLNWVGVHSWLHHLGPLTKLLYSSRDVGPAVLSRIVSSPRTLRLFPREFQERASYRSIRPAGSSWLRPRLTEVPIKLNTQVMSAKPQNSHLELELSDGTHKGVDHALLATGFRVDISRYPFLSDDIKKKLKSVNGYPVLTRGLESNVPGLHFMGKPASWSYGPLLCFVSGTEFAAKELLRAFSSRDRGR
jgi:FAD-dependent urate hydroxylase